MHKRQVCSRVRALLPLTDDQRGNKSKQNEISSLSPAPPSERQAARWSRAKPSGGIPCQIQSDSENAQSQRIPCSHSITGTAHPNSANLNLCHIYIYIYNPYIHTYIRSYVYIHIHTNLHAPTGQPPTLTPTL